VQGLATLLLNAYRPKLPVVIPHVFQCGSAQILFFPVLVNIVLRTVL
jgi:hypothetical protein